MNIIFTSKILQVEGKKRQKCKLQPVKLVIGIVFLIGALLFSVNFSYEFARMCICFAEESKFV